MGQSRLQSLWETAQNIGIGFTISYLGTLYFVFPIQQYWQEWFGATDSATLALVITGFYTVLSIARQYGLRRYHNWKLTRAAKVAERYNRKEGVIPQRETLAVNRG